ncbi:hypothetical protein BC941DRAFT_482119 [Chlamydoabsidia padenii]|nr:hypothetical protein BC941DRAFT_482119 [Chlamydoabsidia padenii]
MKFTFVIAALFAASAIAAPCGKKHGGDDVAIPDAPIPDAPEAPTPDSEDEIKKVSEKKESHNEQTAVINNNSPQGSSHGSLIQADVLNNALAGGVLADTTNQIKQHN